VPTTPGPIAQTVTSAPSARAAASASRRSRSRHRRRSRRPTRSSSRAAPGLAARGASRTARRAARRPRAERTHPDAAERRARGCDLLCSEHATTGIPSRLSGGRVLLDVAPRELHGVYGSFITCAPSAAPRSRPRVRFACSTSNPPDPSASSLAWTLTDDVVADLDRPRQCGYATHGAPSTSSRTSPSCSSRIAVTRPRPKAQHRARRRSARA
jgi:hypothetical protein